MDGYPSLVFFKGESEQKNRLKMVKDMFPGSMISALGLSDDELKGIYMVSSDTNPGIYYLLDTSSESPQITPLGQYWRSIDYSNLATMDPFEFTTRDGATVFGYITKSRIGDS